MPELIKAVSFHQRRPWGFCYIDLNVPTIFSSTQAPVHPAESDFRADDFWDFWINVLLTVTMKSYYRLECDAV
jgi:hypothetical protein